MATSKIEQKKEFLDLQGLQVYHSKIVSYIKQCIQKQDDILRPLIESIPNFSVKIINSISELPEHPTKDEKATLFLIMLTDTSGKKDNTQNKYEEYIWANNKYEKLGDLELDLTDYALRKDCIYLINYDKGTFTLTYGEGKKEYIVVEYVKNIQDIEIATESIPNERVTRFIRPFALTFKDNEDKTKTLENHLIIPNIELLTEKDFPINNFLEEDLIDTGEGEGKRYNNIATENLKYGMLTVYDYYLLRKNINYNKVLHSLNDLKDMYIQWGKKKIFTPTIEVLKTAEIQKFQVGITISDYQQQKQSQSNITIQQQNDVILNITERLQNNYNTQTQNATTVKYVVTLIVDYENNWFDIENETVLTNTEKFEEIVFELLDGTKITKTINVGSSVEEQQTTEE